MEYIIILLEGVITFISPCMLPMLPIYLSYFAASETDKNSKTKTLINVVFFVIGFTIIFTLLGVFSASLGVFLKTNMNIVNIILGSVVILLGINFTGVIKLPIINKSRGISNIKNKATFVSSFLFGIIFAVTWTPCVGTFLGAALSIIAISSNIIKGITLILVYCLGLGIPFLISALFIDKLKNTFDGIKKHYKTINIVCGIFLCIIGLLMVTGLIDKYFSLII